MIAWVLMAMIAGRPETPVFAARSQESCLATMQHVMGLPGTQDATFRCIAAPLEPETEEQ